MGDERRRAWGRDGHRGRRRAEATAEFPAMPYPADAKFTVKHIAYLHAYCRKEPREIVARYPKALSLAQVHLALAHYFSDRGNPSTPSSRPKSASTARERSTRRR